MVSLWGRLGGSSGKLCGDKVRASSLPIVVLYGFHGVEGHIFPKNGDSFLADVGAF